MRRFFSISKVILMGSLLLLASGALVFAGGQEEAAGGEAEAEQIELDVWLVRDRYAVDLTEWEQQYPNITINYEVVPWERTLDQLILTAGSNQAPDVSVLDMGWIPVLVDAGHLRPNDDLMQDVVAQSELDDFVESSWEFARVDGTTYAMPFANMGRALFYRADWFEEAGIDPPETWDDVIAAAKELQDPDQGIWGLSVRGKRDDGTTQGWLPIFYNMGGEFVNEVPQVDSEAGIAALELYQDLVHEHEVMSPDTVSFGSGEARGLFLSGNAAMAIIGSHIAPAVVENGIPYGDFRLTHIPRPEEGMQPKNVNTGFQWAILENTEHPEAAMRFLEYATSTEAQAAFNIDYMEAVRKSVYEIDEYTDAKPWTDFIQADQQNARPLPKLGNYNEVSTAIQRALQEMLQDPNADPAAVAAEAQARIDEAVGN